RAPSPRRWGAPAGAAPGRCVSPPSVPARRDPADIAERIRHLGELHQAGLVTDAEFSTKKAELLAEL
ncbi:SHOCT domain-containing protein, partial [Streptomyces sp. NPDC005799]|uniref:SHOCT domain-containing protein n=1 Tax=Streptomyces sp. NPDC005799 TaxID=3154678 RepID=UPI0033FF3798